MGMERGMMRHYLDPLEGDYQTRDCQQSRQVDEVNGCDRVHDHASSGSPVCADGQEIR